MKKLLSLMLVPLILLTFCACGQGDAITADEALNIALKQAGVTREDIRNLESTLDRENGAAVYEIDFDVGNVEYSYDINAETGAIVERDRDRQD